MGKTIARVLTGTVAAATLLAACSTPSRAPAAKTERKTLRVAVLFTTAGPAGELAQAVLGSAALVQNEAERRGITLQLVQEDYAGDPKKVPALVADALRRSDAIIVGTNDPAVVPYLGGTQGRPILHPLLSEDSLLAGNPVAFRFGPSNKTQAEVLVRFLADHRGYRRISLLTDDAAFGQEGRRDLRAALSDAGLTPTLDETFTQGKDIHTPVAHAGQRNVDAMIVWTTSESEASRIVVEAQKMSFGYQIALSGNLANATFAKNANAQVTPVAFRDGILSVGPWAGPWFRLKRIISFYEDFQRENSALASIHGSQVYDAALALVEAAAREGVTPSDLVRGLESLQDFAGAGVPLTFGTEQHEGMEPDDLAIYGFTKNQNAAGGDFMPDVDTGGGFFTVVNSSLNLPKDLAFLANGLTSSPEGSPSP